MRRNTLRQSDNLIVVSWTFFLNTRKSVDSLLELTLISSNVFPFVSTSSCSTSTLCGPEKVTKETSSNMLSPFGNLCDQSRNAWHGFSWRGSSDWKLFAPGLLVFGHQGFTIGRPTPALGLQIRQFLQRMPQLEQNSQTCTLHFLQHFINDGDSEVETTVNLAPTS